MSRARTGCCDPRLPIPAGAGIDRRRFMLAAAGGLVSVYGADRLGLTGRVFADGIAQAATVQGSDSPVLVSIFLAGGIDALSVLAPPDARGIAGGRNSVHRGPGSELGSGRRLVRAAARRRQDDGVPRDWLRR